MDEDYYKAIKALDELVETALRETVTNRKFDGQNFLDFVGKDVGDYWDTLPRKDGLLVYGPYDLEDLVGVGRSDLSLVIDVITDDDIVSGFSISLMDHSSQSVSGPNRFRPEIDEIFHLDLGEFSTLEEMENLFNKTMDFGDGTAKVSLVGDALDEIFPNSPANIEMALTNKGPVISDRLRRDIDREFLPEYAKEAFEKVDAEQAAQYKELAGDVEVPDTVEGAGKDTVPDDLSSLDTPTNVVGKDSTGLDVKLSVSDDGYVQIWRATDDPGRLVISDFEKTGGGGRSGLGQQNYFSATPEYADEYSGGNRKLFQFETKIKPNEILNIDLPSLRNTHPELVSLFYDVEAPGGPIRLKGNIQSNIGKLKELGYKAVGTSVTGNQRVGQVQFEIIPLIEDLDETYGIKAIDTPTNVVDDMTWLYKNQSIADLQDFLKDKYGNVLYEYGISTMEARSGLLLEELSDGSLYVDTINIRPGSQGQGKGQEILSIIKDWADVNKTSVYIKPAALPDNLTYKGQPVSSEQQLDNLTEFYKKQGWKENPNFTLLSPDEKAAQMSLSANYDFGTKPTELYSPLVYTPEGVNVSELPQNPYIDDITSFTDKFNREGKIFLDGYNQPIVNEVITETLKIEVWYGTSGFIDENDWNQSKFSEVAKDLEAKGLHPNDIVNDLSKYIPPDKIPTPAEIFRGGVRNEYFTDAIVTMLSEGSGNFYIEDVAGDDLFPENKPRRNLGLYYAISGETPEETNARLADYKRKHGDVFTPQGPEELKWVQYAAEGERVIDTPTNVGDDVVEGTVTRMEEYRFKKLIEEVEEATPPVHKITPEQASTIDDAIEETMALLNREKFELIQGSKNRTFKNVDITYEQAFKVIKNKLINIFADGLTLVDAYELGLIIMSITGAVDTSLEGIIDIVFPNDTKDNRSFPEKVIANLDDLAPYSPTEQFLRKNKESRAMKLNPEVVETARDSYNIGDITFFEHMAVLDQVIKGQKSYVYEELTPNIGMIPTKMIDHANPQYVFYNIGETIIGNK